MRLLQKALTFDDVLLVPAHSAVLPRDVSLATRLTRKISLNISTAYAEHKGTKINIVDSPGYASFIGHAKGALRVCEAAMFVIDGVNGIGVQTEKAQKSASNGDCRPGVQ